jgi:predicted dehydrogenase
MADKLNWGVMGNAAIARVCMIPAIQKSRNGVVRALASRSADGAAPVAGVNRIPQVYGNYRALVDDPSIEAIYIALPNGLHHEWTCKALAAGKHVLCEKPLACNAGEAREMAAAAADSGCLLMEAFMYRFHPRSLQIRQLVQSGKIGPPRLIRAAFCYHMAEEKFRQPENFRMDPAMGGGALLDVGCYGVSAARWIYGAEPFQVQCEACFHPNGVDIHTTAMLRFEEDRIATVEASFLAGLQQTYTVVGERGVIDLPQDAFIPWEKDASYTLRKKDADSGDPVSVPGADEYQLMAEHFADAVRGNASLGFSPGDSINNMRVLDALAEAARSHRAVRL